MTNSSAPDTVPSGNVAATTARITAPATPTVKTAKKPTPAKPTAKAATKARPRSAPKAIATVAAAKPVAKPTARPASKPVAAQKPKKKSASTKADKNVKPKKAKLVRDSFTMPESEYELIAAVKKRCVAKGLAVKKSEVLRAAIIGFAAQSDAAVTAALQALAVIKTGRPPKAQK